MTHEGTDIPDNALGTPSDPATIERGLAGIDDQLREIRRRLAGAPVEPPRPGAAPTTDHPTPRPLPPSAQPDLVPAQAWAGQIVADAESRAARIVAEAEARASRLLGDAESRAVRGIEEAESQVIELKHQIEALIAVRQRFDRAAESIIAEIEEARRRVAAADDLDGPAPQPVEWSGLEADRFFSGLVTLDAEPLSGPATIATLETALRSVPGVADVYLRSVDGPRMTLELSLPGPLALVDELRRVCTLPFEVTHTEPSRLAIRLTGMFAAPQEL